MCNYGSVAAAGNGVNGIQFPTWFFGDRVVNESSTETSFIQTDWIAASAQLKPGTIPVGLENGNKYFNYYLCALLIFLNASQELPKDATRHNCQKSSL